MCTTLLRIALLGTLAACGGGPERKSADKESPERAVRAREVDKATLEKLKLFEQTYRKLAATPDRALESDLARQRIELCASPDSAFWLARLFVRDAIVALDEGNAGEADFLRVATSPQHRILDRAVAQLVAMGPHAVPCVRDDLLQHTYPDRRELGVRLLHAIGPAAVPAVLPLAGADDPSIRRVAVETLAGMQEEAEARAALDKALGDPHFAVRGAAWAAFARMRDPDLVRLCKALAEDPDPYVRRSLARELGRFPDPRVREALLAYRARCVREKESRGLEVVDEALNSKGRK